MEIDVQVLINKLKVELGDLTIGNVTLGIQIEKLNEVIMERNKQIEVDQEVINSLRNRCVEAENALAELRKVAHPQNLKKSKA